MVTHWTGKDGYERCRGNWQKESGEWVNTRQLSIHRLCVVAWDGYDAVEDRDVHHRLPVPWLNVESNLLPVPSAEHSVLTDDFRRNGQRKSVKEAVLEGFGNA